MKNYNYNLAREIIETFLKFDNIQDVSMGMQEDWFWTGISIWSDGKFTEDLMDNDEADILHAEYVKARENCMSLFDDGMKKFEPCMMNGIMGSQWATPVIKITMEDGNEKTFECFIGESCDDVLKKIKMEMDCTTNSGFLSGLSNDIHSKEKVEIFKKKQ